MKKLFILSLLIICTIISACSGSKDTSSQQNISTQSQAQSQSSQSQATTSEQLKLRLPASAKKTDTAGLYQFDNGSDNYSEIVSVDISGDVIRFEYIMPGLDSSTTKIVLYSMSEDEKLGEVMLGEGLWATGVLKGGGFYAVDCEKFEVYFYDRSGKQTLYRQIVTAERPSNYVKISDDGNYLLYNRLSDGKLALYDFAAEKADKISDDNGFFDDIEYRDGYFFISDNSSVFKVSAKNKTKEKIFTSDSFSIATTQNTVSNINGYLVVAPFYVSTKDIMTKASGQNELVYKANDRKFVTCDYDQNENTIKVYDFADKTITTGFTLTTSLYDMAFYKDDILLIATTDAEKVYYYFYDLSEATQTPIDVTPVDKSIYIDFPIPTWVGSEQVKKLAQQILDEHGVRAMFGNDDFDLSDYGFEAQDVDEKEILPKLQALNDVIEYFPQGMFKELSYDTEVWIYFTGSISYEDTTNYVGGFATQIGRTPFVVVDTSFTDPLFKEIMVHETSHLIDRLAGDWLDGWIALMPQLVADSYLNSYDKYDDKYTAYGTGEVWFYNQYSRTFPTEDRAVIFEKMYLSTQEGELTDEFSKHENLRKKAAYYSEMMRDVFESCKNADTLPWEELFRAK